VTGAVRVLSEAENLEERWGQTKREHDELCSSMDEWRTQAASRPELEADLAAAITGARGAAGEAVKVRDAGDPQGGMRRLEEAFDSLRPWSEALTNRLHLKRWSGCIESLSAIAPGLGSQASAARSTIEELVAAADKMAKDPAQAAGHYAGCSQRLLSTLESFLTTWLEAMWSVSDASADKVPWQAADQWLQQLVVTAEAAGHTPCLGRALIGRGLINGGGISPIRDYGQAKASYERAKSVFHELQQPQWESEGWDGVAQCLAASGDWLGAVEEVQTAVQLLAAAGHKEYQRRVEQRVVAYARNAKQFEVAAGAAQRMADLSRELGNSASESWALTQRAECLRPDVASNGSWDLSLAAYEKLAHRAGASLIAVGRTVRNSSTKGAIEAAYRLFEIQAKLCKNDKTALAAALFEQAQCRDKSLYPSGDWEDAISLYRRCLDALGGSNSALAAKARYRLATCLAPDNNSAGDWRKAATEFAAAGEAYGGLKQSVDQANCLHLQGYCLTKASPTPYADAAAAFGRAARLRGLEKNGSGQGNSLFWQAFCLDRHDGKNGDREAQELYGRASRLLEQADDRSSAGNARMMLGECIVEGLSVDKDPSDIDRFLGNDGTTPWRSARTEFEQARKLLSEASDHKGASKCREWIGKCDRAIARLEELASKARQRKALESLLRSAAQAAKAQSYPQLIRDAEAAEKLASQHGTETQLGRALALQGAFWLDSRNPRRDNSRGAPLAERAVTLLKDKPGTERDVAGIMSTLALALSPQNNPNGNWSRAIHYAEQAVSAHKRLGDRKSEGGAYWCLGHLQDPNNNPYGNPARAAEAYERAYNLAGGTFTVEQQADMLLAAANCCQKAYGLGSAKQRSLLQTAAQKYRQCGDYSSAQMIEMLLRNM
ncbi:MAG: hypothetical protein KDG44_19295, partial [Burkholderiaceae bacterium]|nr:hypothetical protein [Burkholderiaceae bacterium]